MVQLFPVFSVLVKVDEKRRQRREDGRPVVCFQERDVDLGRREGLD
jgi:hypothetical protein